MESGPKILIIDDDKDFIYVTKKYFEAEGFIVFDFSGYTEDVLPKIKEIDPDIVLLDVIMPESDGFSAFQSIRDCKELKDIPIFFVTSDQNPNSLKLGFELGADDFVKKPIQYYELKARILARLSKGEEIQESRKDINFINLDFGSFMEELKRSVFWSEGKKYFEKRYVRMIVLSSDREMIALMKRQNRNLVSISITADKILYKCTCEVTGEICRHVVGAGIYLNANRIQMIKRDLSGLRFFPKIKAFIYRKLFGGKDLIVKSFTPLDDQHTSSPGS